MKEIKLFNEMSTLDYFKDKKSKIENWVFALTKQVLLGSDPYNMAGREENKFKVPKIDKGLSEMSVKIKQKSVKEFIEDDGFVNIEWEFAEYEFIHKILDLEMLKLKPEKLNIQFDGNFKLEPQKLILEIKSPNQIIRDEDKLIVKEAKIKIIQNYERVIDELNKEIEGFNRTVYTIISEAAFERKRKFIDEDNRLVGL